MLSLESPCCKVPLRNRKGETVAHSIINEADYDRVMQGRWSLSKDGYANGTCGDFKGLLHRFIMGAKKGDPRLDHVNNNRLDNRIENLRFATPSENAMNKSKEKNSTSKYLGVYLDNRDKIWVCSFLDKEKKKETFRFEKEEHAAYWYDVLRTKEFGTKYKINNVAKPDDFIEPCKKRVVNSRSIYQRSNGKFFASIGFNNERITVGTYNTEEDAIKAYDKKKAELELQLEQSRSDIIKRNTDGYAIIEVYTNGTLVECIVDDDIYFELNKFRWSFSNGYVARRDGDTNMYIHRHVMGAKNGDCSIIDHINNNPLDNRKVNLRVSDSSLNNHNRKKLTKTTSVYHGVSFDKQREKYVAQVAKDGINYWLGRFKNELDAARAYNEKAIELYEEYAKLNKIN
jgi:hypothetical protein